MWHPGFMLLNATGAWLHQSTIRLIIKKLEMFHMEEIPLYRTRLSARICFKKQLIHRVPIIFLPVICTNYKNFLCFINVCIKHQKATVSLITHEIHFIINQNSLVQRLVINLELTGSELRLLSIPVCGIEDVDISHGSRAEPPLWSSKELFSPNNNPHSRVTSSY